ncbi:hypothetical protein D3C71_1875190 [compost metagenome]
MINRGPEKFGFSVHDLPDGIFARSTKFYLKILLSVIHPDGGARLKERSEVLVPKLILMPVSELLKKMNKQLPHDERSVRKRKPQQEEALSLNDSLTEVELPGATVTN